jgi:hypothetical protein
MNIAAAAVLDDRSDNTVVLGTPGVFMPNLLEALVLSGQIDAQQPSAGVVEVAVTAAETVHYNRREGSKGPECVWTPTGFSDTVAAA